MPVRPSRGIECLVGGGTSGVPVAERCARGRASREKEVGAVDPAPGPPVDDDRLRFGASARVNEHHAALLGSQASVAPRREHHDHRPQRTARGR